MKRFVLYLFFLSSFGNALAQDLSFNTEKLVALDAFILDEIEANRIAGAEVYIHHNGEAVWHKALGKSNSEGPEALKKNSLYYIQSMTKPIISTAIMQLVEQGKINLNDSIEKYLPEAANLRVTTAPNQGRQGQQ